VLQQTTVAEPVFDAALQPLELVAQPDDPGADVLAMAVDDAARLLCRHVGNRHPDRAEGVDRHRPDGLRVARCAEAGDPVTVEQRHYHAGLDVGRGREYDDRLAHAPTVCAALTSCTFNSNMVISSC
jgi:hypothetical protein